MSSGGKRSGAGRRPGPVDPATNQSLAARIRSEPSLEERVVVALSSHGATVEVIAATLGLDVDATVAQFGRLIQAGGFVLQLNTLNLLWQRGQRGNVSALIYLSRRMDAMARREGGRR